MGDLAAVLRHGEGVEVVVAVDEGEWLVGWTREAARVGREVGEHEVEEHRHGSALLAVASTAHDGIELGGFESRRHRTTVHGVDRRKEAVAVLGAMRTARVLPNLQVLGLARCGLGEGESAELVRTLQDGAHVAGLRFLDLTGNELGRGGGERVAAALVGASHVRSMEAVLVG